ncbi:MAG: hypothetical protein RIC85_04065 [Gammaproteobacteria bacterium]
MTLSAVSGYFTYQGAVLILDQAASQGLFSLSGFVFSLGVSAALFLFWRYALGIVPTMNTRKTRLLGLGIIGLGGVFIVCLSSWMNVMALAGAGALEAHMRGSMKAYESTLQDAYNQAKNIDSLVADLDLSAQKYGGLAEQEIRRGVLTGVAGAGGVADSLLATQKGFSDLAALIRTKSKYYDDQSALGRTAIGEMNRLLTSDGAVMQRHTAFTAAASKVGNVVGELDATELTQLIARSARGFSSGTGLFSLSLKNGKLATAQGEALNRIASDIASTGERIAVAAETLGKAKPVTSPSFEQISLAKAVFIYAGDLIPYWAGGIGLDLMPVVLILLLMLMFHAAENNPRTDPEIDGMPFGQVRKVILALDDMRGNAVQHTEAPPRLPLKEHMTTPAALPDQPGLSEDEKDEWERHLKGV